MLTADFVSAVRRQGAIVSDYPSSDILGVGDGEVRDVFVPLLESLRQNFMVRELVATPDARGRVALPPRCVAGGVRSVHLVINNSWVQLPQRNMEENDSTSGGLAAAYFLDGGSLVLVPAGSTATLRIRYAIRPGAMVLNTDAANAARIDSVTAGASTYTFTTSPAFTGGTTVDVVSYGSTHHPKCVTATRAGLVVQAADFIEAPVVGDYLCTFDTSPFIPLPEELSGALVHRTAGVILRSLAYEEEAASQLTLAAETIARATPMLTPRNEGNPQVIKGGLRRALYQGVRGRRFW